VVAWLLVNCDVLEVAIYVLEVAIYVLEVAIYVLEVALGCIKSGDWMY
jgi:hypothetical protein